MDDEITKIIEKYPFLSYGKMLDEEYLGIIQNSDNQMLSMYCLNYMPVELRKQFLKYGEEWWWESNRSVPINIFIKDRFKVYRPYLKHFNRKDFDLQCGYALSLQEAIAKRVRTKQVILVKNI
jgi:hypothetical protein